MEKEREQIIVSSLERVESKSQELVKETKKIMNQARELLHTVNKGSDAPIEDISNKVSKDYKQPNNRLDHVSNITYDEILENIQETRKYLNDLLEILK